MKKGYALAATVAALGLLVGCGTQSKTTKSSSSKQTSALSSKKAKKTSSSKKESAKDTKEPEAVKKTRLETLNDAMKEKIPELALPTTLDSGNQTINAAVSGDANNYRVDYRFGGEEAELNAGNVTYDNANLAFQKVTYQNSTQAQEAAQSGYQILQDGLRTLDLGDNQKATQEGAAGSVYTVWHEGNWSITVIGSNMSGNNGTELAKQAVALFKTQALPAPDDKAVVTLYANNQSGRANRITYRKGNALYVFGGSDAMQLLRAATSLK